MKKDAERQRKRYHGDRSNERNYSLKAVISNIIKYNNIRFPHGCINLHPLIQVMPFYDVPWKFEFKVMGLWAAIYTEGHKTIFRQGKKGFYLS
jgi:hypothetical protein